MSVTKSTLSPESNVDQYTLTNQNKTLTVKVLNYGATLSHILTPDKTGQIRDVVLGFDDFASYQSPSNRYFGAVVGRFANRIGHGKFELDGKEYTLATNNGPNALHGGLRGFDKQLWDVEVVSQHPASLRLSLESPDGDQGYPGTLINHVTYTVRDDATLTIEYHATLASDQVKPTIVNLTNHTYFNLAGVALDPTVLNTHITMSDNVRGFLELNDTGVPTGKQLSWSDQPCMAFSGERIGARLDQLPQTKGYDHPYLLHHDGFTTSTSTLQQAVVATHPTTGIQLSFATTEPAFQFYTGKWLGTQLVAKKSQGQVPLGPYAGFCLESSRYPDAPNKPEWQPSVVLYPGQVYASKTVFGFSTTDTY